jgi:hypothetical protein
MGSTTYYVELGRLNEVIEQIYDRVPEIFTERILDESSKLIRKRMRENTPVGRFGRQKPSLQDSITIEKISDEETHIGPTKKVDGYDLGTIMELGSKGGQIIKPRAPVRRMRLLREPEIVKPAKKALRFYWKKTGKIHYMNKVTRGTIEPFYFIRKTAGQMRQELVPLVKKIIGEEYRKNSTRYQTDAWMVK